jgi:YHS domain-containing protein
VRIIIWLILGYLGYRIVKGFLAGRQKSAPSVITGTETFQDPVCGVYVTSDDAVVGRMEEKKLYFCSIGCLEKYRERLHTENK